MKLRFLDARNCHALLPPVHGLPIARLLDEYLRRHVNDKRGEQHGSIDAPRQAIYKGLRDPADMTDY